MYDREFEARSEPNARLSRREVEQTKELPDAPLQRDPLEHTTDHNRAGQSLLRLQRHYGNRYVQRVLTLACKGEAEVQLTPETEETIHRSRRGGQPLADNVRGQLESAIGADFGGVRIHSDAQADTLSREVNARAFTVGEDIYFRQGAYEPGSSNGRELLAHELTHVVQQSGGGVQRKLTVSQPGDKYEQEADQVAQAVTRMEQSGAANPAATPPLQRQVEEEKKDETVQTKAEPGSLQRQSEEENTDENT